jgi:16S rRNA (cytidine1402-2'-O)-methyltransferase
MKGKLYLIPTTLGDNNPMEVLPIKVKQVIEQTNHFIVENSKTARRFIKKICPEKEQSILILYPLDKRVESIDTQSYLDICVEGVDVGLLSEAGVPAIADPGAVIVEQAHKKNIQVVPLVGPSSILLAMMSSGFNGQNFTFNGYLPIDSKERKNTLKFLERLSKEKGQSQIFIETPYRNDKMLVDLLQVLQPNTMLCIATDITLESEYIRTLSVKEWKNTAKPKLHKRPTIFILHRFY